MPVNLGGRRFAANRKRNNNEKADTDFPWAEDVGQLSSGSDVLGQVSEVGDHSRFYA